MSGNSLRVWLRVVWSSLLWMSFSLHPFTCGSSEDQLLRGALLLVTEIDNIVQVMVSISSCDLVCVHLHPQDAWGVTHHVDP